MNSVIFDSSHNSCTYFLILIKCWHTKDSGHRVNYCVRCYGPGNTVWHYFLDSFFFLPKNCLHPKRPAEYTNCEQPLRTMRYLCAFGESLGLGASLYSAIAEISIHLALNVSLSRSLVLALAFSLVSFGIVRVLIQFLCCIYIAIYFPPCVLVRIKCLVFTFYRHIYRI